MHFKNSMKPRLIILSDLWGKYRSDWIITYTKSLNQKFDIKYYDCCELGKIDTSIYSQDAIHKQFIKSGIEIAVKRLFELEKGKINILAFSVGGVIAWKAGLIGLEIETFYAVSSTRLGNEIKKPKGNIKVFYGSEDKYRPQIDWSKNLNIACQIIGNKNHEMYKENEIASEICEEMLKPFANKVC